MKKCSTFSHSLTGVPVIFGISQNPIIIKVKASFMYKIIKAKNKLKYKNQKKPRKKKQKKKNMYSTTIKICI